MHQIFKVENLQALQETMAQLLRDLAIVAKHDPEATVHIQVTVLSSLPPPPELQEKTMPLPRLQ